MHQLALNENPYPPLPSVQEAMRRAASRANRYPDVYPDRLAERERLRHGLGDRGWRVLPSHTNCLWLAEPEHTGECEAALAAAGVRARYYAGEGVRLTVGDRSANDAVLTALTPQGRVFRTS